MKGALEPRVTAAKPFETDGFFYRVLESDAARWSRRDERREQASGNATIRAPRASRLPSLSDDLSAAERRPLALHPPRPRSRHLSDLPPPARSRNESGITLGPRQYASIAPRLTSSRPSQPQREVPMSEAARRIPFAHDERSAMLEELEELRYQVAEAKRATDERKSMFLRELNKLLLERDTLQARVDRLEHELHQAQRMALAIERKQRHSIRIKRGLAATGGIATATGVLLLLKNALHLGRSRASWFRAA